MTGGFGIWLLCIWLETEHSPMLWGLLASVVAMVAGSFISFKHPVTVDGN